MPSASRAALHLVAGERLLPGEQPRRRPRCTVTCSAPEPAERLRHLDPDRAAAEHDQPARHALRRGGVRGCPTAARRPGRAIGGQRALACRWRARRRGGRGRVVGAVAPPVTRTMRAPSSRPVAAQQVDAVLLEPGQLARVAPAAGHVVALGERGGDVDRPGHRLRRAGHPPGRGHDVARAGSASCSGCSPSRSTRRRPARARPARPTAHRRRTGRRRSRRPGPPPITTTSYSVHPASSPPGPDPLRADRGQRCDAERQDGDPRELAVA